MNPVTSRHSRTIRALLAVLILSGAAVDVLAQSKKSKKKAPAVPDPVGQIHLFEGHDGPVLAVAYAPNGKFVVSGGRDKTLRTWDVVKGKAGAVLQGLTVPVSSVALLPNGRSALTAGYDPEALIIWDLQRGLPATRLKGGSHSRVAAVSANGSVVVSAGGGAKLDFWNAATGAKLGQIDTQIVIDAACLSPDARWVAAVAVEPETVRLWETATGRPLRLFKGHTAPVRCVAFAPDGKSLVTASVDRSIRVWKLDQDDPEQILTLHTEAVNTVAFSPDGKRLLSGGDEGAVILWKVEDGAEQVTYKDHTKGVSSVAFSPDGRRAVSGSADGTVRVWGLPE